MGDERPGNASLAAGISSFFPKVNIAVAISGASSDPSAAFASGFTLWQGWR